MIMYLLRHEVVFEAHVSETQVYELMAGSARPPTCP